MGSEWSYGISSGRRSASMLTDSVFAFDVGAAARSIFSRAICNITFVVCLIKEQHRRMHTNTEKLNINP